MPALRKYEASHPWLTFEQGLRHAPPRLWIALGEAQSKCRHLAGVPLLPSVAARLHTIYLARGLLATTAIEGNTLTEREVQEHLDHKLKLPPSRQYLAREIDNVLAACNTMLNNIAAGKTVPLSTMLIGQFNKQVLDGLKLDPEVVPGTIRKNAVGVGSYRGAPAEDCDYLLDRICEWLNTGFRPEPGNEIIFGLVKSIIGHVYLAWIHPFGDGNGRTARLLEVKFLLEAGVPSDAAHLLSNHYNQTRSEYYRQLEQTSRSKGDLLPFMEYAVGGYVDQLREQIDTIQKQQLLVSWVNYVHEKLGAGNSPSERRQRDVVLALSEKDRFLRPPEIKELTPAIAAQYARKTAKTLSRDLNRLEKLGLVVRRPEGYRANSDIMRAFLPPSLGNRVAADARDGSDAAKENPQLDLGLTNTGQS